MKLILLSYIKWGKENGSPRRRSAELESQNTYNLLLLNRGYVCHRNKDKCICNSTRETNRWRKRGCEHVRFSGCGTFRLLFFHTTYIHVGLFLCWSISSSRSFTKQPTKRRKVNPRRPCCRVSDLFHYLWSIWSGSSEREKRKELAK